jgi:CelD/BcsL family acetyltransferase involved in cellulose biosynthesis
VQVMTAAAPPRTETARNVTIETVSEERAFLQLADEWDETVARAHVPHPFLSHDWMRTWWECFGRGAQLHIVIVRSQGAIAAIAPLLLERAWMYGMPVRRLRLLQNDHSHRADFIVAGDPESSYRAIWSALFAERQAWDVLQLSQLAPETATLETMTALAGADGCATGVWRGGSAPYLSIRGTESQFFAGLSAKFRQNLRNRMTRLTKVGQPSLEIVGDAGVADAVQDAIRLEESGWKRSEGTAISADPALRRFYGLLAERLSQRDQLRVMFLNVAGRRIATSYSIQDRGRLFLCKTGYDPEYNTCSPFKLLMHFIVRYAYAEGLDEVDLLGDFEPWKEEWTETSRPHDWLFVFSDSNRARVLYPLKFQLAPAVKRSRFLNS